MENDLSEAMMARYERAWKRRLGQEIRNGIRMREIYTRLPDTKLDFLVNPAASDGIIPLIKNRAKFD